LTFFWCISVHLNDPFYKKGATENVQVYPGAPLLAVATGMAVLKAITTAKAKAGFRLGKNSVKFFIIKDDTKSK